MLSLLLVFNNYLFSGNLPPSEHRGPYKTFNHLDIRVPETIRRCIHYKGKNTTWNQVQNGF